MKSDVAIGIDIGGTKIAGGLVTREGLTGKICTTPTDAGEGGRAILSRAIELAQNVMADFSNFEPTAIGVATGGWVQQSNGRVITATNLLPGWTGMELGKEFARATGLRAVAINDVHAMGLAEARLGAGRGCRVCLSVAVGTGIGGAITIDGEVIAGARGMAGAIGHIALRSGGPRCSCGKRGCVETYASGPAIARQFARCAGMGIRSTQLSGVVGALSSPSERIRGCALRATSFAGAALGRVLAGIANTIDPDLIVVGGGAALALGAPFFAAMRSEVAAGVMSPSAVEIVPPGLGTDAGVVGAGLAALWSS